MKVAIFGSRSITEVDLKNFIPEGVTEIVSGGARGIDTLAAEYARENGIKLVEFLPEYKLYGRGAPVIRDKLIAEYADEGIAFWDGSSAGTKHTINYFKELGKKLRIYLKC